MILASSMGDVLDEPERSSFQYIKSEEADQCLEAYKKQYSAMWPILHSPWIETVHKNRYHLEDPFEKAALYMVYDNGALYLKRTSGVCDVDPEGCMEGALQYVDTIVKDQSIEAVQILMLFAVYSLRGLLGGSGTWQVSL